MLQACKSSQNRLINVSSIVDIMTLQKAIVDGNRLSLSRQELEVALEACIATQLEYKAKNDMNMWLFSAGYIEALKDLLSSFDRDAQ